MRLKLLRRRLLLLFLLLPLLDDLVQQTTKRVLLLLILLLLVCLRLVGLRGRLLLLPLLLLAGDGAEYSAESLLRLAALSLSVHHRTEDR